MALPVSLLLGLVQGITEFLPVSSSGHLTILENIFKLNYDEASNLFFNVMLHVGTLISVILYYRKDLKLMLIEIFAVWSGKYIGGRDEGGHKLPRYRLSILLGVATLPMLLVLPVRSYVEQLFGELTFVAIALLVTGALLFVSDRIKPGLKRERQVSILDAVLVGFSQAVAVIPGLSRSGSTIVTGLARGFKRSFAVRFSFLLSIPAVFGSFVIELINAISIGIDWNLFPIYLAGMAVSAVVGYFTISFVQKLVLRTKLSGLAYYTWAVGIIALIVSFFI